MQLLKNLDSKISHHSWLLHAIIALLGRLTVGIVFLGAGLQKLSNIQVYSEMFAEIKIPLPMISVYVVGIFEFLCGLAIILGWMTRIAAVPLMVIMVVALLTVKIPGMTELKDFFMAMDWLLFLILGLFLSKGPGHWSIDHKFGHGCSKNCH